MYSKILAVGRKLRRYENLLNNYEQFAHSYKEIIGNTPCELRCCGETIIKMVAKYRCIYNNLINQIK